MAPVIVFPQFAVCDAGHGEMPGVWPTPPAASLCRDRCGVTATRFAIKRVANDTNGDSVALPTRGVIAAAAEVDQYRIRGG